MIVHASAAEGEFLYLLDCNAADETGQATEPGRLLALSSAVCDSHSTEAYRLK